MIVLFPRNSLPNKLVSLTYFISFNMTHWFDQIHDILKIKLLLNSHFFLVYPNILTRFCTSVIHQALN